MLGGFPANNILNYDETNLSDDPGAEKLIFKCGKKYPEHIMNYSKGNTSIMFSGTAAGELLHFTWFTNPDICGSHGQLVVQKELGLTDQKWVV